MKIKNLGSSGVKIVFDNNIVVYFNPSTAENEDKADMIFLTNKDNNPELTSLIKPDTHLFFPDKTGFNSNNIHVMEEKQVLSVNNFQVIAFPAKKTLLGYVVSYKGKTIYYSGENSIIPEMKNLKNINIAFFPSWNNNFSEIASFFKPDALILLDNDDNNIDYKNSVVLKKNEIKII